MADDNGNGRKVLVPILWSACMLLGGALIGNVMARGVSKGEIDLLVKQGDLVHLRIDATNSDQEARIRLLEDAVRRLVVISERLEIRDGGR